MANESAKKLLKKNFVVLRNAALFAALFFVLHLIGLWFFESASGGWTSIIVYFVINAAALAFFYISSRPKFDASGSLLNSGQDLSQKGIMDYVWDFLYVTWFCQVATLYSAWLWLLMLLVPIYGAVKLFGFARSMGGLAGGMGQPAQEESDAPTKRSRATKEAPKIKFAKGNR